MLKIIPKLLKLGSSFKDSKDTELVVNIVFHIKFNCLSCKLKAVGILTNQASNNPSRSVNFYKELVAIKFMPSICKFLNQVPKISSLHKYIIQVISVIVHPMFGEVMLFPWRKHTSGSNYNLKCCLFYLALNEFNEFLPVIDSIKSQFV